MAKPKWRKRASGVKKTGGTVAVRGADLAYIASVADLSNNGAPEAGLGKASAYVKDVFTRKDVPKTQSAGAAMRSAYGSLKANKWSLAAGTVAYGIVRRKMPAGPSLPVPFSGGKRFRLW